MPLVKNTKEHIRRASVAAITSFTQTTLTAALAVTRLATSGHVTTEKVLGALHEANRKIPLLITSHPTPPSHQTRADEADTAAEKKARNNFAALCEQINQLAVNILKNGGKARLLTPDETNELSHSLLDIETKTPDLIKNKQRLEHQLRLLTSSIQSKAHYTVRVSINSAIASTVKAKELKKLKLASSAACGEISSINLSISYHEELIKNKIPAFGLAADPASQATSNIEQKLIDKKLLEITQSQNTLENKLKQIKQVRHREAAKASRLLLEKKKYYQQLLKLTSLIHQVNLDVNKLKSDTRTLNDRIDALNAKNYKHRAIGDSVPIIKKIVTDKEFNIEHDIAILTKKNELPSERKIKAIEHKSVRRLAEMHNIKILIQRAEENVTKNTVECLEVKIKQLTSFISSSEINIENHKVGVNKTKSIWVMLCELASRCLSTIFKPAQKEPTEIIIDSEIEKAKKEIEKLKAEKTEACGINRNISDINQLIKLFNYNYRLSVTNDKVLPPKRTADQSTPKKTQSLDAAQSILFKPSREELERINRQLLSPRNTPIDNRYFTLISSSDTTQTAQKYCPIKKPEAHYPETDSAKLSNDCRYFS